MSAKQPSGGVDRRLFLAGTVAALAVPAASQAATGDLVFYIGTYGAAGASTLSYATAYDKWTLGKSDPTLVNASFGVYSPKAKRHYIVNEQDNGTIGVYQSNSQGKMNKKGEVSSHGKSPCYLSLDATEGYLAVANYGSGDIAVYKLDAKTGLPIEPATIKQNAGTGPNAQRQEGPHAHWVKWSADQKFIYSIDLGTDEILGYSFDAASGAIGDKFTAFKCEPGFGPRHMVVHSSGQVAHLVGELASAIVTLRPNPDGTFIGTQWTSSLPADYKDPSFAAHIAYNSDGNRLYVSNRGHNSIATFFLDATGRIGLMQHCPTGNWPRHFFIINGLDRILVADQNGNDLRVLGMHLDGTLYTTDVTLNVTSPVFIGAVA